MVKANKKLVILVLLVAMVIGSVLASGYVHIKTSTAKPQTQTQIIEDITSEEAYTLIQENKGNLNFVILDVRTPEEFVRDHIGNAINLDYYSETFKGDLNRLDKNKTYLIYCQIGGRSKMVLGIVKELGFREAYNMLGGITQWKAKEMPTTK
ncbi:MAG: rhodanese-like domain-containing protein [Deltaproteobacteria bacterium]|nr:rhodanese-like domain-containing protein [Deltaproteobacteria bacterium]